MSIDIFISYSHKDRKLRDELVIHLSNLRNQGIIHDWHDGDLVPGTEWQPQILEHLKKAQIILLLVSADYMKSSFCYEVELKEAMIRHETKQACVLPIILRPADWEGAPFAQLQVLPSGGKPLTEWATHDSAFADIIKGIRRAIQDLSPIMVDTASEETRQFPLWYVPYRRNPYFTGQEAVLTHLHQILHSHKTAALTQPQAIHGLGGIGKTQIALEYAYRHRDEYDAVFWITAESRELLTLDIIKLANLLHLPQKNIQDQTVIIEAVKHWLETHNRWLLILDNANVVATIESFLPSTERGHILLTTQAQAFGTLAQGISVEQMELTEGALLLLHRAKILAPNATLDQAPVLDRTLAETIVSHLGGIPLAIDQAGAYIEETHCGLQGYQERYQSQLSTLLHRRSNLTKDHPASVATTWLLCFERIQQDNPTAAEVLRLCAFVHADNICEEFFTVEVPNCEPSTLCNNSVVLDEAISVLLNYSLIRRHSETNTLSMHHLVQAVLRDTLSEKQKCFWAERAIYTLSSLFPPAAPTPWKMCERYIVHVQFCTQYIEYWKAIIAEVIDLLHTADSYLLERAFYGEAESSLERTLAICEQMLGTNHQDTARTLIMLGYLYHERGNYAKAESFCQRAVSLCEQIFGPDSPETAESLNNLGWLYNTLERYIEAEPLFQRALSIYEQTLGPNHPFTSSPLNNLGHIYHAQEKYIEAETFYQRTLSIREQTLGSDHPETATILSNLGGLYSSQDNYIQAELLYRRVLSIREKVLGPEHPATATSLNNLASVLDSQGNYAEGEQLYRRALSIREKMLGLNHPNTALSLSNLACCLEDQGNYVEAQPFVRLALEIYERTLGSKHPTTLMEADHLFKNKKSVRKSHKRIKRSQPRK